MKYLLLGFIFWGNFMNGQDTDNGKNVDKILLLNHRSAKDNYILAKSIISQNDIEIANSDPDIYQVKTGLIKWKMNMESYYVIGCKDSMVVMRGMYKMNRNWLLGDSGVNKGCDIISHPRQKDFKYNGIFGAMNEFAKLFKADTMIYEVSKKLN